MVIDILRMTTQLELNFSKHIELYDMLIPEDNFWRQLNDMIDFSFVVDLLKDKYSIVVDKRKFLDKYSINAFGYTNLKIELF